MLAEAGPDAAAGPAAPLAMPATADAPPAPAAVLPMSSDGADAALAPATLPSMGAPRLPAFAGALASVFPTGAARAPAATCTAGIGALACLPFASPAPGDAFGAIFARAS